ncbi:hypothetical protein GOB94_09955 [Granulicella sp. 5B5]|uniref:hypothetical protein n=1 Tax=Granulicella sp. 5B5 TaxID=1617967 RepID=UPI00176A8B10|nr:hypothetical protein [Granulicella sp. 5B5]QMV18958.1 hypothetical protein GOB94_09955 [Granulicella sp. 5B5]
MTGMDEEVVPERRSLWRRGWVRAVVVAVLVVGMGLLITAEYVAHHAEPLLRHAVIDTLEERFHEPVELDGLTVSVVRGLQVQGHGLRLLPEQGSHKPLVKIDRFSFHASMDDLLHLRARVNLIHVQGLEMHIPPHSMHTVVMGKAHKPAVKLTVGKVVCDDALLVIDTDKPGKEPLEFQINNLVLNDFGADKPFEYQADLINPKPMGRIHAFGNFGPWNAESPRDTAVNGQYTFTHADLSTIKGIKGMLDSTGHFAGVLGNITVDGTTYVPDFALEGRGRALPLKTTFHAFVDGTTGDTTLAPVQAVLGSSAFTASGTVARVKLSQGEETNVGTRQNLGHDITLTVNMPHGRIEDMLNLAVKADQPLMRGAMTMQAKLHIPPGKISVADKLQLAGTVTITGVEFTSKPLQDKVDGLSMRAQGKPKDVKDAAHDSKAEVASQMTVQFVMGGGMLKAESIQYELPGAHVQMKGVYALNTHTFEFDGHVRTDAKASQMVTGWKSALLKPFDPIFAKNGAGLELPISVDGVNGDYKIGLHDSKLTADQMAAQMEKRKQ